MEALTEDDQTITLLEDASLGNWNNYKGLQYSFTLRSEGGATLTAEDELDLASNSSTEVRNIRLENITVAFDGKRDALTVGKNIHLTLEEGAVLTNPSGTAVQADKSNRNIAAFGTFVMEAGSCIQSSQNGIDIGDHLTGGLNFYMEEGAEITDCKYGVYIGDDQDFPCVADIRGSIKNNHSKNKRQVGGLVCKGGKVKISEGAEITDNFMINAENQEVPGNISVYKDVVLDLTDLNEDARLGFTFPNAAPTVDSPVRIAEIDPNLTECPDGIKLDDESFQYQLSVGTKLEAGNLYLIDPNGNPAAELEGSGTEKDPFRVTTYDELKRAFDQANLRSVMTYVRVDDSIEFLDTVAMKNRTLLTGKATLYSDDPENTVLSMQGNYLYIAGEAELVLHDIHLQGAPAFGDPSAISYVANVGGKSPSGKITIQDGTIIEGFSSSAVSLGDYMVDIRMEGGVIRDCGYAMSSGGNIELLGGHFENLRYVASLLNSEKDIRIGEGVSFENNETDFVITSDSYTSKLILTGRRENGLKLEVPQDRKAEILTAEDASFLENWKENITAVNVNGNPLELKSSDDGTQLFVMGSDRKAIQFSHEDNMLVGAFYNSGTNKKRAGFDAAESSAVYYNGYDLGVQISKVQMSVPDLKDSKGETLTNKNGDIVNFDSPDLEMRAFVDGTPVGTTERTTRDAAVIDGIPGNVGAGEIEVYLYYKGTDEYFPAQVGPSKFHVDPFEVYNHFDGKWADGFNAPKTAGSVAYIGEEVFPDVTVTIKNSNLQNEETVTLERDKDYYFAPMEGENCINVGEAKAQILFKGNYTIYGIYVPNRGWPVEYEIIKGSSSVLEVEPYHFTVKKEDTSEQAINLSELQITPAQASYKYEIGEIGGEDKAKYFAESGAPDIKDSELTFTLKADAPAGEVVIPVKVDSDNASGTANIIVTITDKTSGAVELRQDGKSSFYDALDDAWKYVKAGEVVPEIYLSGKADSGATTLDKAVIIDGGKTGGLLGGFFIEHEDVVIRKTDLSEADITDQTNGGNINLTQNYWGPQGSDAALSMGLSRSQIFPYYKDAAMTQLVNDPKPALSAAIREANEMIYQGNYSELTSLLDIEDKMNDPQVQSFLWSRKDELKAIIDALESSVDKDELERYLASDQDAAAEYKQLYLAYIVSCTVIPQASKPDTTEVTNSAQTEAGSLVFEAAKQEIGDNGAVASYLPVFGSDGLEALWDAVEEEVGTDAAEEIEALYVRVNVKTKAITVEESAETPEINRLQFEVEAEYKTSDSGETKAEFENKAWKKLPAGAAKDVTFRLPIPKSVTKKYARVEHEGDADRYPAIQEENGAKYITLTVSHFSSFDVSFMDELPKSSTGSSGSGSGGSSTIRNNGTWHQDNVGWWFAKTGGGYPADQWYECYWNGQMKWYHFNAQGYLDAGWFIDKDGATYYLHNQHDNQFGYMYTGWNWIDGKCYYFTPNTIAGGPKQGMLYKNGITPDGYSVNETGAWTVNGVVQTKKETDTE